MSDNEITQSSGNVFADLGLPDAETLQEKSALVFGISEAIKARGWSAADAAEALGLTQAELGELLRGNLDAVEVERIRGAARRV